MKKSPPNACIKNAPLMAANASNDPTARSIPPGENHIGHSHTYDPVDRHFGKDVFDVSRRQEHRVVKGENDDKCDEKQQHAILLEEPDHLNLFPAFHD
ncbi:hypothetical protein [Pseudomonas fluorescens]|uniref:hypothetical protein n=1 Tax=Pseudomonas fluorescens TaxID=294 RepID=UPI00193D0B7F|nr:hypothetical protein [Pseudomonas fluorescens]